MQGLGMSHKSLRKLVNKMHVGLVAILEHFQHEDKILRFVNSLDFNDCCTNVNEGGKIWVMWNVNIQLDVVHLLSQMIMGWMVRNGSKILTIVVSSKSGFYDRRTL